MIPLCRNINHAGFTTFDATLAPESSALSSPLLLLLLLLLLLVSFSLFDSRSLRSSLVLWCRFCFSLPCDLPLDSAAVVSPMCSVSAWVFLPRLSVPLLPESSLVYSAEYALLLLDLYADASPLLLRPLRDRFRCFDLSRSCDCCCFASPSLDSVRTASFASCSFSCHRDRGDCGGPSSGSKKLCFDGSFSVCSLDGRFSTFCCPVDLQLH